MDGMVRLKDTVSLTQAADMLGFDSFRAVKELIRKGHLKSYRLKFNRNQRVLRKEVEALTILEEVNESGSTA